MLGQLIKHKHKLGGFITSEYYKNPVFSTEGELIGSIALFHDKTTEMAKTESQKKFYKSISEYLSLHTVQNIYNNVYFGADSFQEEKELTVAFIDIVNYTLLCEEYPEETIMRMLNVFYEKSASYIQNYRGIIDKFIGDCVLGYFIKPDACIKAAKDLLGEGLFSLNKKLRYLNLPEISFRIGIDTGKVKIGNIGGAFRKEYTLIGDTVNTASRIQGIAPPRSIVFTENTYSKLINKRGIKYMDEVKVKGKKNTIKLYALHYKA
jgi:adenylate cyclase